jgi:ribosomal protein L31E
MGIAPGHLVPASAKPVKRVNCHLQRSKTKENVFLFNDDASERGIKHLKMKLKVHVHHH